MNLTLPRRKHRRPRTGEDQYAGQPLNPGEQIEAALKRATGPQETLTFDVPGTKQPTFTPAPVTMTGPQQALRYVPGFYVVPTDGPLPFAEEAAAATGLAPVTVRCDLCGTIYQGQVQGEGDAPELAHVDRVYLALWHAAVTAGWRKRRADLKTCCPDCIAAANLPRLAGGPSAEVSLMISLRTASGAYEDLTAQRRRYDRREERRRRAEQRAVQPSVYISNSEAS